MVTQQFICANGKSNSTDCKEVGRYSCKNCFLVLYCGPVCQKSHWIHHKRDCKSPLSKGTWRPGWALENREPAFMGSGRGGVQFGGKKYFWGNIPAFDILRLGSNEGDDYGGQIHLLFAASGDLRNVVKSITQIPHCYNQSVDVTMNDHDIDIVVRNAIMLLIALVVDNADDAIDCILHVWYSALIRRSDLNLLQERIRPLIQTVCENIEDKAPGGLLGKTWTFGQRSLRLVLKKSSWNDLLRSVNIPEGLTAEGANQVRTAVVLAESRKDYRDRHLLFQTPSHRVAINRLWQDGVLLPFGTPCNDFREPNPTFFQSIDTWPMHDNANPLNGWSRKEVEETSSGPATADIYGKLFYCVRAALRAFLLRLSGLQISFRLFQVDASELTDYLEKASFSRIEVSNIADGGYLGLPHTIGVMVPLLQEPLVNPHATLVTLLMNVVEENRTDQDKMADMTPQSPTTKRLLKYLPFTGSAPINNWDPRIIKFSFARDIVATYDHIFDRFLENFPFFDAARMVGAAMKEKHSVIEKWPFRLKLRPGQTGAQEEFDRLLSGGVSGQERYIEWRRINMYEDGIKEKQ